MSDKIKITLPDASVLEAGVDATVYAIAGMIGKGIQQAAVSAMVNGLHVDLTFVPATDSELKLFTFNSPEGRDVFWHSSSHLMAQAIKRLYPEAKFAIGPVIDSGFYYDFDLPVSLNEQNFAEIEEEMARISGEALPVSRELLSKEEALRLFRSAGEIYKAEMIEAMEETEVSIYRQGEFFDLCRGPHLINTSSVKSLKLLNVAGAYWRGDEKNKMLQRIYGVSFPDSKQLKKHLELLEEARDRDHRKLGRELDLFSFSSSVGAGLPLWHPNGAVLRFVIDKFSTEEHLRRGYKLLTVPHIARSELYETSGHLSFYSENMYAPIKIDEHDYYLKPMNCPSQIQIFNAVSKSYRDLPYRFFEMGTVYRYEKSGSLHGLTRVRGFTQDDAHIFCTPAQLEDEIGKVLDFTLDMLRIFGFSERSIYLSTRPGKSVGTDENWELATTALKNSLDKSGIEYTLDPGEGVFYGPKIDVKIKDALGREWQCSTIQVDFNLPERFDISYVGTDGGRHRPIMIHRALLGSLERFIGILIEHYGGRFPLWLAPVQLALVSVSENEAEYAENLKNRLVSLLIRAESDVRNESVSYKIRDAISNKVPYIAVIGKKEIENGTLSVRKRGSKDAFNVSIDEFIGRLQEESSSKK